MAKIIYQKDKKRVALSVAEYILLGLAELGTGLVESFLPKKYPQSTFTRALLGLDSVPRNSIYHELYRLKARGLVVPSRSDGKSIKLTANGKRLVRRIGLKLSPARKRDGAWHVVIFDIPERLHKSRDLLRYELRSLGFIKLQASVWISTEPITEEFYEFLKDRSLLSCAIVLKVVDASQSERIRSLLKNSRHRALSVQ
ncbi:MAG: hypothetical protein A3C11_02700 [Candidatus Sungbacteria bacterium RIFCSPHIGHO2_02_FULL_49_12]|uniref:Transcriptional repressor PaaX-like central Cas2-like domain-containing protein n=1 Tax=Candidatus Sungbacteria bacterium RIFCSPHIGHO2_02_FULL_49_12 TaxID=1802271 RepID=A0A1G2KU98_9BACT|nr:MAG: hypothetical protein A3C11_02700 [Candidatus Sungbacteria bacterium RIFCSPHIGHO2_02_FULL_49_12]